MKCPLQNGDGCPVLPELHFDVRFPAVQALDRDFGVMDDFWLLHHIDA